jgi:xanthine dehydrogenase YagS FAD-binding subunit
MRPFVYVRADDAPAVANAFAASGREGPPTSADAQFIAGGTTILDLMKLDVMRPSALIDINGVEGLDGVERTRDGLRLGALARMADVAVHPLVRRDYPVIAESLVLAASAQLRNMATLGGNVLQRTRCTYFRDPSWAACNKRTPGSGCAALDGVNRTHAVLGVSPQCIATYPGDFAQALIALDAVVATQRGSERRTIPFASLHRAPADRPEVETTLAPGEMIVGFVVPVGDWTRRSRYLKIRDRESYEFALASAAVALDMPPGGPVRQARIALGGVATVPWRAREARRF